MSLRLVNYGGRSLTGMNSMLWTIESHTHGPSFSKGGKIYWQSDYNFIIIIKMKKTLGRTFVYSAPGPSSSGTLPLCTQSLDSHRLHTQGLILQKQWLGELMKGHAHLSTEGRKILASLACSIDWGKHQGFLTLVIVAVLINSNNFFLCLLR